MPTEREALLEFLRDRDAGCPSCGYNLRGLDAGACPECGRPLRVTLVGDGRPSGWWFGMLGLATGCGLTAALLVVCAVMIAIGGWSDEPLALLTVALCVVILGGQAWALSRWIVGDRRTAWAGVVAWAVAFGPLLGLWGVMGVVLALV